MVQRIFPSVMAKTQSDLSKLLASLDGIAKVLHLDIADGQAVPNTSLWFPFRLSSKFGYNAHLMIKNPEKWIKKNGRKVNLCIPQFSEIKNVSKYLAFIKNRNKKVAFAIKPETKVSELKPYLKATDYILILTVHPGFYGAKYLKSPLSKIAQIKKYNQKIKIIVDGHMDPNTVKEAKKAGADYFVSGSFISKSNNPKKAIKELRRVISA